MFGTDILALSGTDVHALSGTEMRSVLPSVSYYTRGTQHPVLRWRMCYTECGIDPAYGAAQCAVLT
eukprot:259222-Rhodomonas_salina.1